LSYSGWHLRLLESSQRGQRGRKNPCSLLPGEGGGEQSFWGKCRGKLWEQATLFLPGEEPKR